VSEYTETTVVDVESPSGRKPAVLAVAALGALVAGALVWLFVVSPLLTGGDPAAADDASASVTASAGPGEIVAAAALGDPVEEEALPLVTYEVFLDRDPFDPVVPEPTQTAAEGTTSTEGGVGDTTDGSGGTTDLTAGSTDGATEQPAPDSGGGTDVGAPAPSPGCSSGEELVCDGRVVSLLDIRTDEDGQPVAIVQVGSTVYEARVGETFAGTFRVQSISGDQVFLLYGDDGFDLREGDRVLK
jgi:hypothetical protein